MGHVWSDGTFENDTLLEYVDMLLSTISATSGSRPKTKSIRDKMSAIRVSLLQAGITLIWPA